MPAAGTLLSRQELGPGFLPSGRRCIKEVAVTRVVCCSSRLLPLVLLEAHTRQSDSCTECSLTQEAAFPLVCLYVPI